MDVDPSEVVNLTAGDVLELRQSYAAIAEHSARVARIMGRLAGLDEATALPSLPSGNLLADGSAEKRKRKRKRDPDAPKRPASSFLMFLLEHRPIMRERHPNLSYSELMKEIGAMWKGLPSKDREVCGHGLGSASGAVLASIEYANMRKYVCDVDGRARLGVSTALRSESRDVCQGTAGICGVQVRK